MRQIIIFFCICIGFYDFSLKAQDAEKILQAMEKKFENAEDISGVFKYGIGNYNKRTAEQKGDFILKKGDKFFIQLNGQKIYCDGEKQWVYFIEDNEVNVMTFDPDEGVNIDQVFSLYKSNANPRYDGEEEVHDVNCHKIYLAFNDKTLEYNQAVLWINKRNNNLEKAVTIDRMQTQTTYEFIEMKFNQGFPDTQFVFEVNDYPGVVVYDETE